MGLRRGKEVDEKLDDGVMTIIFVNILIPFKKVSDDGVDDGGNGDVK